MNEDELEERYNNKIEQMHTDFKEPKFQIQDDIYSLAYAGLINPDQLEYTEEEIAKKSFLPKDLSLTRRERAGLYQSALMVVFIQVTTIFLLVMYFRTDEDQKDLEAPKTYLILIPRLLSSFMMHLQVESDIRNGLKLMKYAVNHPFMFTAQTHNE